MKTVLTLVTTLVVLGVACSRTQTPPQPETSNPPLTPAAAPAGPEAHPGYRPPARPGCRDNFALFDDDEDGVVSRDEFASRPHAHADAEALFRSRDANADGKLTESEFCSGWRPGPAGGRGAGWAAGKGAAPMRRQRATRPMMGLGCERNFEYFDADGDGKLTATEFGAWPHARGDANTLLEARDKDDDGSLTLDEFCSAWR